MQWQAQHTMFSHDTRKKEAEECSELTCFAIPKSASLTTPIESTSKFAPLISLFVEETSPDLKYRHTMANSVTKITQQSVIACS